MQRPRRGQTSDVAADQTTTHDPTTMGHPAPSPVDERTVLTVQGGYYVLTGAAPFVSRRAFEAVTGPKTEWWLVQTVGAIVTAVGVALLSGARSGRITPELRLLAAGCAAALAAIDTVHVARRRIAPTYLLDAAAQLAVLAALRRVTMRTRHR